ncbi:MAG: hypothetical protein QME66_00330 [Candidatus Eisenbacteria bacterium]|nr:hypothetical protein [Candidatus Eisenbacteria bacterium]
MPKRAGFFFSLLTLVLLLMPQLSLAQTNAAGAQAGGQQNNFAGGFGPTWINGDAWYGLYLVPEFSFGKIGLGLRVDLQYNPKTGQIRPGTKKWEKGSDYIKAIRYVRYGQKRDFIYGRIGGLTDSYVAHGLIMYHYTNELSYDDRKVGLELGLNMKKGGFEAITSNLSESDVVGARVFYRPLEGRIGIPIIKKLTVGASYVTDLNDAAADSGGSKVSIWGPDLELPFLSTPLFETMLYSDFAKITNHGQGAAFGIMGVLKGIVGGNLGLSAKFERRELGKEFIPGYFGTLYEKERFGSGMRKSDTIELFKKPISGYFGELSATVLGKITVLGNYQDYNGDNVLGVIHVVADAPSLVPKAVLTGTYDKAGIKDFGDAWKLNENSIMRVEVGYRLNPFLVFVTEYRWNFVYDPVTNTYKTQKRISPRVMLSYKF